MKKNFSAEWQDWKIKLRAQAHAMMPKWFGRAWQPLLEATESGKTVAEWWQKIFWQSIGIGIAGLFLVSLQDNPLLFLAGTLSFLAPFLGWYFFLVLKAEQCKRQKEEMVPDLLLSCSTFPKGTDTMTLLRFSASGHFGLLGKEFEKACIEIQDGASVPEALHRMQKRCKSRVIDRMTGLLAMGYESGADLSKVFKEAADDLYETRFLVQERQAALWVEKYTLLIAGGLVVPLILGFVAGLTRQLDFSGIGQELLGTGLGASQREVLLGASLLGTRLYLVEYALLASFFVANQEGNWKKGVLYALVLLPMGWTAFWLAAGNY